MSNEHPRIHMNSSEFHKRCSWQVRFWTFVFTCFDLLLCVVVFAFVGFIVLRVFFFHPVLAWRSQKLSTAIVAKHGFFSCFGMSENVVTFFPFNVTILGSKKDTSCWNTPICSYIVLDMWFCCFHAVLACPILNISGWNLQIHFSTKGFTLAQKITSDPHISKESDIHHSQNNEETFEKLFAKKTCNSKNPKETNMEKNCVFGLNCWKYSLVEKNKVSNKTVFRLFG